MDGTIKSWSTVTGTKVRSYAAFSKIYDMNLSRTESTIATGHNDSIRLWSNKSFQSIMKFDDAHSGPISCLKFTTDDQYLISSSTDHSIKVWDIRQGKLLQTFEHDKLVIGSSSTKFCISPNN